MAQRGAPARACSCCSSLAALKLDRCWMELFDDQSKHCFYFNAGSGESQRGYPHGWDRRAYEYSMDRYYLSDDEEARLRKEEKKRRRAAAKAALKEVELARKAAKKGNRVVPDARLYIYIYALIYVYICIAAFHVP